MLGPKESLMGDKWNPRKDCIDLLYLIRVLVYEKEDRREIYWFGGRDSVSHRTAGL